MKIEKNYINSPGLYDIKKIEVFNALLIDNVIGANYGENCSRYLKQLSIIYRGDEKVYFGGKGLLIYCRFFNGFLLSAFFSVNILIINLSSYIFQIAVLKITAQLIFFCVFT